MAATRNVPCPQSRNDCILRNFSAFQQSHTHKRLKRRTWRIKPLRYTVNQRSLPVFVQCLPCISVYTVNKQVRIERRLGNECQDITVLRIDGNQCTTPTFQQAVCFQLHTDVQRKTQSLPHLRRNVFQYTYDITVSIFFHLLITGHAVQLVLIICF